MEINNGENEMGNESKLVPEIQSFTKKQLHKMDRHQRRINVGRNEQFKKDRDVVFGQQDVTQESIELNVAGSMKKNETDRKWKDDHEEYEKAEGFEEGVDEFRHLNIDGVARIADETEFSDGRKADGTYRDGYWFEPTEEETAEFDAQLLKDIKDNERTAAFRHTQTYGGRRIEGIKNARGVR